MKRKKLKQTKKHGIIQIVENITEYRFDLSAF